MIISIDFDDTWTADPDLWKAFARQAKRRGHTVILATNRAPRRDLMFPVEQAVTPWVDAIVFAGPSPKREAVARRGYDVDVWIDDYPSSVDYGRW